MAMNVIDGEDEMNLNCRVLYNCRKTIVRFQNLFTSDFYFESNCVGGPIYFRLHIEYITKGEKHFNSINIVYVPNQQYIVPPYPLSRF